VLVALQIGVVSANIWSDQPLKVVRSFVAEQCQASYVLGLVIWTTLSQKTSLTLTFVTFW